MVTKQRDYTLADEQRFRGLFT